MAERRRKARRKSTSTGEIRIAIERSGGPNLERSAKVVDQSEWGIGFECLTPMIVGSTVLVWGDAVHATEERPRRVQVLHVRLADEDLYRAGCSFEDAPKHQPSTANAPDTALEDLYEVLQVSPTADSETIHRIYRILAQRYHPDNPETGSATAFQAVLHAYQTLSDAEKRAAYDVSYQASKNLRWEIFEKPTDVEGVQIEKRMRAGVLAALYNLRSRTPESSGMTVRELEDLLGCPREHMEFAMWYLRKKNLVSTASNGRFEITIEGCDAAESAHDEGLAPRTTRLKELPAARQAQRQAS